jgi:NAD(P)H dehydrogenase (quinone)
MTILITGASGHLGRLAVEATLARGVAAGDVVAGARNLDAVADLAERGIRTAHVDYTVPASLDAAFEGVETVVLISSDAVGQRASQHAAVIDAAKKAGVAHFVYTSAPRATTSALILAPEHKATEEAIVASGLNSTILRNAWYTENYAGTVAQAAAAGELVASVGDGRVSSASRADYAEAIAAVLTSDGHEGAVYELSGDAAWSHDELAEVISGITGKSVAYRAVSSEEHAAYLAAAGLDEGTIGFVVGLDANTRDGLLGETSGDLARLIGRPTTPLAEGLAAAIAAA